MSLNRSKIEAFTLSEIIIVLILTSIVVALAFSTLRLVQYQMQGMTSNLNQNAHLNRLETSLYLDFNRYATIEYSNNRNALMFSSPTRRTTYTFRENYVIKEDDTLLIATKKLSVFLDGKTIADGPVDGLKLELTNDFQEQSLFVFKEKDATFYMN